MQFLPTELLQMIVQHLSIKDWIQLRQTCACLYAIVRQSSFEEIHEFYLRFWNLQRRISIDSSLPIWNRIQHSIVLKTDVEDERMLNMLANLKMPRSVVHFLSKFEVSDITCKRLLQWSCKNGYLHVTRTILDKRNLFDVKWLYYSARVGDVESCAYLLQFLEEWDTTIWIASMDSGSYQVATLFLEYGDFESLDTTDQFIIAKKAVEQTFEMMTLFLDKAHPDVYDMIDETQQTLMHCAAANPDPQIIQYVGKRSRARDAPDRIGMTPLKIAQMLQLESVQVAILSL